MNKPKVLFLCTGNSARSQMAEAFLKAHASGLFDAYSAGLEPKDQILPEVLMVMQERGVSMDGQAPKSVREYLGKVVFAHTITVCGDAEENCPAVFLSMGKHEHWPFEDPAQFQGAASEKIEFTRKIRDQIDLRVQAWLDEQNTPAHLT
jgi:arsenate reductase (thioredoxin)